MKLKISLIEGEEDFWVTSRDLTEEEILLMKEPDDQFIEEVVNPIIRILNSRVGKSENKLFLHKIPGREDFLKS